MKQLILFLTFLTFLSCNNKPEKSTQSNLTDTPNNKEEKITVTAPKTTEIEVDSTKIDTASKTTDVENSLNNANVRLAAPSNNDFSKFYEQFIEAIKTKNIQKFNALINTNFGVYIIESSGAMPKISKLYDIANYKSATNTKFLALNFKAIKQKPSKETLPKVICGKTIYDKQGCFYQETNPLLKSQIWNYAGLNEKEIQAITVFANTVKITVVSTLNYTYYFSFNDNQWHIAFIDLRIPCNA